jgi:pepF/M3 family oligoendopeptidase
MTQATSTLPHWQLTSIFPGLDSPEYQDAKTKLRQAITALEAFMDEANVRSSAPPSLTDETVATAEALLARLNAVYQEASDLWAYLYGFVSTDAFDDIANAELSALKPLSSKLSMLGKRSVAWLGRLDLDRLLETSATAREHRYFLTRAQITARHLLGDEAEALASALEPTAGSAWGKLHGDLISRETITATLPGKREGEYGLAELKNLQADDDPEVRRAAYLTELELLERHSVSHAAAMNSIKGQVAELCRRRGWESPLDEALFDSAISREALAAMQTACEESFPDFRRYLKAKAKFLGKEQLGWYDLFAPLSIGKPKRYGWDEAKRFVIERFRSYSDALADFAARSFDEGWFDVPPRKGKTNGAFCMNVPGRQESRILLNFGGTLDDLFTLAHELGHAYHNHCMYTFNRTMLQSDTPMTLAETASIFCETVVIHALLARASDEEKLAVLEQDLQGAAQLVLDIHSRFLFEQGVFARRAERELSLEELKALMLEAQAATYGDALADNERHPYMWAHKGHYYSSGRSFYNYPYTFGYLFGLGLYAEYQRDPEGFKARYDELLASTGMADADALAAEFGIDIEDPAFWRQSLAIARKRVDAFEQLVERLAV